MNPLIKQEPRPIINPLVTTKPHVENHDLRKKLKMQEEIQIAKDLEKLGISFKRDPLNAFTEKADSSSELAEDIEQEDQGITSFTGHSLNGRSKIDAFESKSN
jgi:hypothetical protein